MFFCDGGAMAMAPLLAQTPGAGIFESGNAMRAFSPASCERIAVLRRVNLSAVGNRWCRDSRLRVRARALQENLQQGAGMAVSAAAQAPVRGVLFDMDGVLCDSEERSREAAVDLFAEYGVQVKPEDFIPFMGTGEANFLGGVAGVYGIQNFDPIIAKKRFFEIYIEKYAKPNSGLGYAGALDLVMECKKAGLKLAVASSADRIKVDANLSAAGLPPENFDAIVSADVFERLKPAPDIFLAAASALGLPPAECVVIEDALAGIQAAQAAGMRCIAVSTTLSVEKLAEAAPTVIKLNIGNIRLTDILSLQGSAEGTADDIKPASNVKTPAPARSITRRDISRLLTAGVGVTVVAFWAGRWKSVTTSMQYFSPMSLWNSVMGVGNGIPLANATEFYAARKFGLKNYIADIEAKGGRKVPEFPPGLRWFNTAAPLRFKGALRGKVVILDFWTYCCINCMHVLPDLAYIENKYSDQPVEVVGVHSAKFNNEKDNEAIRNAVLRYNITHPVVNDDEMRLWRELGINSWPTFVVVGPTGNVLATSAGENHREDLDLLVSAALDYYGEKKLLSPEPIPQALERNKDTRLISSPLSFPGKMATDLANGRLFISDSNHHRIVITDLNGNFLMQVGSGVEGLDDGSFNVASFNRPQGVEYNSAKDVLYVADTENHSLREIDFVNESVKTLVGTGEQGQDYAGGKSGREQPLNSPWDLCLHPNGKLYIAMAGHHQIWECDTSSSVARAFSGNGYERNYNNPKGSKSSFAQPSGVSLAPDLSCLYVADSESSSVRYVDLKTGGTLLLSGGDPFLPDNLFEFGDKDGSSSNALFQHPLGVLADKTGVIYVADSYNHKIKMLDTSTDQVKTVAGTGAAGYKDGNGREAQFSEPAGLAMGPDGSLFVADTNNDVIRQLKFLGEGKIEVSTLQLNGVRPPEPASKAPRRLRRRATSDMEVVRMQPVTARKGELQLQINLPSGYHFSKEATSKYDVDVEPDESVKVDPASGIFNEGQTTLRFERTTTEVAADLKIISKVYYCQDESVCLYKGVVFQVPLQTGSAEEQVKLTYRVNLPRPGS